MNYTVYVVTNAVTSRQYVGMTMQPLRKRWTAHLRAARDGVKTALYRAIRKHGVEQFEIQPFASAFTREGLGELESLVIKQLGSKAPRGYNLTDGGEGVIGLPPESRARCGRRGYKHTPEARRRISEASKGHGVGEAQRAAIGAAHKGKSLTPEHRAKLAAAKLGRSMPTRTEEHKRRISEGLVRAHARRAAAAKST